jgi:hypothetical protein
MLNLIPILIAVALIFKWDRDKRVYAKSYSEAFLEGAAEGANEAKKYYLATLEPKITAACKSIVSKYELGVKVIENRAVGAEVEGMRTCEQVLCLPAVSVTVCVAPLKKYCIQLKKWDDRHTKEVGRG